MSINLHEWMNVERQQFESWLSETGYAALRYSKEHYSDYVCEETEAAWQAWKARAKIVLNIL